MTTLLIMGLLRRQRRGPANIGFETAMVLWVVALVALVVFAVSNRQQASVDWLFTETETALWIVIAISTVVGAVLGYITARRRA